MNNSNPYGKIEKWELSRLKTHPRLRNPFPVNQKRVDEFAETMKMHGCFDPGSPIRVTPDGYILDGYHRWLAASLAALTHVWVQIVSLEHVQAELEYAIRQQTERRNLTDGDRMHFVMHWYRGFGPGRPALIPQSCGISSDPEDLIKPMTIDELGRSLHCKPTTARKFVALKEFNDTKIIQAVMDGKLSVHAAYLKMREIQKGTEAKDGKTEEKDENLIDSAPSNTTSEITPVTPPTEVSKAKKPREIVYEWIPTRPIPIWLCDVGLIEDVAKATLKTPEEVIAICIRKVLSTLDQPSKFDREKALKAIAPPYPEIPLNDSPPPADPNESSP